VVVGIVTESVVLFELLLDSLRRFRVSDIIGQLVPGQTPGGPPCNDAVRAGFPVNPFRLSSVMVELPDVPGARSRAGGKAEMSKSGAGTGGVPMLTKMKAC
jgi:hypothetical protein